MPSTVHSGLESRSYGSKNTLQCVWSPLDEAQQAQMSAAVTVTVKRLLTCAGGSDYSQKQLHVIASDIWSLSKCIVHNNAWYALLAAESFD